MSFRRLAALPLLAVTLWLRADVAPADIPARDYSYAETADLQRLVAAVFDDERAEAFAGALAARPGRDCPPLTGAPAHRCLGDGPEPYLALIGLLRDALRAGDAEVAEEFLAAVNRERLWRGLRQARWGGEYVSELGLETGAADGLRRLAVRHLFADGRSDVWYYPFSLCPDNPALSAAHRSDLTAADARHRWRLERDDAGRLRLEKAMICDEQSGEWLADGPWRAWHANGREAARGSYRLDRRDGEWSRRDEQGLLVRQTLYRDDREIEDTGIEWTEAGQRRETDTRRRLADRVERETTTWDYHPNGQAHTQRTRLDGYRSGIWIRWDEAGKEIERVEYRRGVPIPPAELADTPDRRTAYDLFLKTAAADAFDAALLRPAALPLGIEAQQALAALTFQALRAADDDHPEIFERFYLMLIEFAADTDRAHEAYWRLTNLYNQAWGEPRHEQVVALLERFLTRYRASKVVSMDKYPDQLLVFSPLRSLHHAYEALGRYQPIADHYAAHTAAGKPMGDEDCFDYASALDRLGRSRDAIRWYELFLARQRDGYGAQIARERLRELRR